jgi:hypothetical protein
MAQQGGAYWALATAQQLAMAVDEPLDDMLKPDITEITEKKSMATIATDTTLVESTADLEDNPAGSYQGKGGRFWGSFLLLLHEQKHRKKWYTILLLSALGGGGK